MNEYLRQIPPVHELQQHPDILSLQRKVGVSSNKMTEWIQQEVNSVRKDILSGSWKIEKTSFVEAIVNKVKQTVLIWDQKRLTSVINATGTIIHTNLGRSRLSDEAIEQVVAVAKNYSNLEYDLQSGKRGSRHNILEELLKEVTGAEAALVVNNNAAAVYMVLQCFAKNKEVIVSRGELVEIGGSFRVSSIMEESGATLKEVGTTNKTHLKDYDEAINENTAMIMKVHTSNFKIVGFTKSVGTAELISLAKAKDTLFYEDLGSGALYDFQKEKIGDEPVVKEIMKNGPDLVSFSGDKLLGGPQVGVIAGKKQFIDQLKRHQLARLLRVDKMTFAALEATLKSYVKGTKEALLNIPTVRDVLRPFEEIKVQTEKFIEASKDLHMFSFSLKSDFSTIGGGTMPGETIKTYGVTIESVKLNSSTLEKRLRLSSTPIIGRFVDEKLYLDFRTLTETDIAEIYRFFKQLNEELHIM
ncbi:L-seryl-tRNA(Ser) seleniumtransferase [Salirhabdus euzebyi]|uniref:L-seryl-tRNA(Sec) selenium transferase n=1 Tax=Salirhabdus euzebyi TaxID=394506 RepID=A0A841PZH5_9BACI|nr:L-seryl-tRNA(Sec) selenium transferase [Salirhabdus euzebyi]MBB6452811.1 L-seryl-tRNA(Ser) seleniumtransferase [Salirhabdus euzebyi]